jgi:predicted ribosomally synthesized peptide with nif11-like leader
LSGRSSCICRDRCGSQKLWFTCRSAVQASISDEQFTAFIEAVKTDTRPQEKLKATDADPLAIAKEAEFEISFQPHQISGLRDQELIRS